MASNPQTVTRIAAGTYRVEHDGRIDIVYVAGPPGGRWAFWNGQVFREADDGVAPVQAAVGVTPSATARRRLGAGVGPRDDKNDVRPAVRARAQAAQPLTAPMPATVIKVLVTAGSRVKKGDAVVVLEAMKMELPIRAPADATVASVHCREGEIVQPDTTLVELM